MRRNLAYSILVFSVLMSYLLFGFTTSTMMGGATWEDFPAIVGLALTIGGVFGGIFYFGFTGIASWIGFKEDHTKPFRATRAFVIVSSILVITGACYGVVASYLKEREKQVLAKQQKENAEVQAAAAQKRVEIEKRRIASLTPQQRVAEEQENRRRKETAARLAAAEVAKKEADARKVISDNKKRDTQLQMAGAGAVRLKRAMKDPNAFILMSLVVMPNGVACYQYRAKNSFGAILPSSAVLTTSGRILLEESRENAFVTAWNGNCTRGGGDEIAPLVKRLGILE